jgi:hypothetical protein
MVRSLMTAGAISLLLTVPVAEARPRHPYIHLHPVIQHNDNLSNSVSAYALQSATVDSYAPVNASMGCADRGDCYYEVASADTGAAPDIGAPAPRPAPKVRIRVPQRATRLSPSRDVPPESVPEPRGSDRGLARLSNGGVVIGWAKPRFEGFFADAARAGYPAGSLRGACYSPGGHQWNSKHHWGGACDGWGQYARGRMHRRHMPPWLEIKLAHKHGLESGCEWHRDRRGPDCGHIQVRGSTSAQYAFYVGGSRVAVTRRRFTHSRRRHHNRYT